MSAFDEWSRMVSSTKTGLTDLEISAIACKDKHDTGKNCCQTAILCAALEKVGGFGTSGLVHCMLAYLGAFLAEHRMIGAVAEEGIEAIHSKLETEMKRHKMSRLERRQNSMKWLAIDVLLSDSGKLVF